jgi:predicted Zn-dependent peptidase
MRAELTLKRFVILTLALVFALGATAGDAAAKKPWEKFKFPELGDITIPDYERHVLANGMTVFLLEDHTWPLVEGQAIIRTGAAFEPASKVGLASLTGNLLRTGGTTNISADELDEMLERMGGTIESSIGDTSGRLFFSFLSQDADKGLNLVADVLRNPAFEGDKLDVAMEGEKAGVARRNDDLNGLVGREIQRAVWGPDHPYARNTEYATLEAISRDDVVGFYEYFYHPDNIMFAVWGDFEPTEMLAALEARFGDWPAGNVEVPELPNEPNETQRRRVLIADKSDVNQARFAMGHIGMRADDEDYYSMSVANRILGGGFGDRLFNEVRTNRGLAYNVGSTPGAGFSTPGIFQAYCGTKSETTEEAIGVVIDTIEQMRAEQVSQQELEDAKEAMLNSNVFNYVQASQVLTRKMNLEYLGYPDDFLERYNESVRAVSADDVQDVMQRRVEPDKFAIVAVGKTEDWDGDLTAFGPVEELDISIPEPEGPEFPDPTPETIEKGRAVLAAAKTAHGGSALNSVTSLRQAASMTLSVQGMELPASVEANFIFPDRMANKINLPFGEVLQVVNGDTGFTSSPQGLQDMGGTELADARGQIVEDTFYLLSNFDGFPVQSLDSEDVNGTTCDVVLVWIDDTSDRWLKMYCDPTTGQVVRTQQKAKNMVTQAPGMGHTDFSDVKDVAGVKVPHKYVNYFDGEKVIDAELTSFELNATIDESLFDRPAS